MAEQVSIMDVHTSENVPYEEQIQQLQAQLIDAMIQNQNLASEVQTLKQKSNISKLYTEISEQKQTILSLRKQLTSRVKTKVKGAFNKKQSSEKSSGDATAVESVDKVDGGRRTGSMASLRFVDDEWNYMDIVDDSDVDVATEVVNDDDVISTPLSAPDNTMSGGVLGWWQTVRVWLYQIMLAAFTNFSHLTQGTQSAADAAATSSGGEDGEQLAVKTLRDNISRLRKETKPVFAYVKQVHNLLTWESPSLTLLAFIVYMYLVWRGWILSAALLYCILQLTLTYINRVEYVPRRGLEEVSSSESDDDGEGQQPVAADSDNPSPLPAAAAAPTDSTDGAAGRYSQKLHLVLQVARKVQNTLGTVADTLEKLDNLLHWQHIEISRYLYTRLCLSFIISLLLPNDILFTLIGFFLGIKLFIIDNIYDRLPHIKEKYDTTHRLWQQLPTNADLEKHYTIDKFILPENPLELQTERKLEKSELSYDNMRFCELFDLPATEHPLSAWRGGRRAALIDKEKSWLSAMKNGKLYLTRSFLCFERTKDKDDSNLKNILIPLSDIMKLNKAKPYSWFPGEGMALEIFVNNKDKSYIFGGILHRDELYESIMRAGRQWSLSWAETDTATGQTQQNATPESHAEKKML